MKLISIALLAISTSAAAVAQHGHRHVHERRQPTPAVVTQTVTVPVEVYEYNGLSLPEEEVCEGIVNGSLHWAANGRSPPDCDSYLASLTVEQAPTPAVAPVPPPLSTTAKASSTSLATPSKVVPHPSAPASATPAAPAVTPPTASPSAAPSTGGGFLSTNPNVSVEFPDGEIDCSTFPSGYGAIEVSWVGHNGWTGVQYADFSDNAVSGLSTGIGGDGCADSSDGSTTFCSYACPPGYQKSQWPSIQGNSSMAVSVGGLRCENGKLWLTNPSLSTYLCVEGTGKSFVSNKLSDSAAICRTDYPGMLHLHICAITRRAHADGWNMQEPRTKRCHSSPRTATPTR